MKSSFCTELEIESVQRWSNFTPALPLATSAFHREFQGKNTYDNTKIRIMRRLCLSLSQGRLLIYLSMFYMNDDNDDLLQEYDISTDLVCKFFYRFFTEKPYSWNRPS